MSPPDGFQRHFPRSGLTDPWEPLYSQILPDRICIGLYLSEAHCNSRGLVHGGLIASLADNAMGLSCVQTLKTAGRDVSGLVTLTLNAEYLGAAKLGQWLVVDTDYVKAGGSICFARAQIRADDAVVALASASFKSSGA